MLKLESAKIVLLGNFNPYIISPEWLSHQSIWSSDDVHFALGAVTGDGVRFRGGGTEWYVTTERLVIASNQADCGSLADAVLRQLPHTPMTAVLSSFSFQVANETTLNIFDAIRSSVASASAAELFRWGTVLHIDDARVDVMFVTGDQGTTVSANHRRSTPNTAAAEEAVKKYNDDRASSEALIQQMVGGKA